MDPFIILAREDGNAFLIVVDRGEIHLICAVLRHITGCHGDISLIVCDGLYDLVKRHALVLGLRSHFFGDGIRDIHIEADDLIFFILIDKGRICRDAGDLQCPFRGS